MLSAAAGFGVIQHLVTPGDAIRTARDILASAGLFRLAIAALVAAAILDIVAARAALAKIHDFQDIWHISLVLSGLHLVLTGYLACTSGYVPRVPGVLLLIAGGGYLAGSLSALLIPGRSVNVAAFTFTGEALLMLWLLARGRHVTPKAQGDVPSAPSPAVHGGGADATYARRAAR